MAEYVVVRGTRHRIPHDVVADGADAVLAFVAALEADSTAPADAGAPTDTNAAADAAGNDA